MADGERTEAPTPRRLAELRRHGDSPRSNEFNIAVTLLVGAVALRSVVPDLVERLQVLLRDALRRPAAVPLDTDALRFFAADVLLQAAMPLLPLLLAIMAAGACSGIVQTGFVANPGQLAPRLSRLNPLDGFKRVFSLNGLMETAKALAKVLIIAAVIAHALWDQREAIVVLVQRDLLAAVAWFAALASEVMLRVAAVLLVLAGLDYLFQKWQWLQRAKMTREEVKEELKSAEGSPQMRQRIREFGRSIAMGRMMQAVPTADVIITNPTHIAVALKYEMGSRAPTVVAKGQRLVAERIKEIARAAGIPIFENKPLAQALFRTVDVGDEIPAVFYQVVAEILAFVYRLRAPRMRMA